MMFGMRTDVYTNRGPMDPGYNSVFRRYVNVSRELMCTAKSILKADCYNEGFRDKIANDKTVLVEYKQSHIDQALSLYPQLTIVQGDIRNLPFENEKFDLIVDLSTIDHVLPKDMSQVIREYDRVLEPDGIILLVAWFSRFANIINYWSPDAQYYLPYKQTKGELKKYFTLVKETVLFKRSESVDTLYIPMTDIAAGIHKPKDYLRRCWRKITRYEYCSLVEFVMEKDGN